LETKRLAQRQKAVETIMKKFFKGWNAFEICFLLSIIILPTVFAIVFKSPAWDCLSTTSYLIWAILVAKGKSYAHIVGIFAELLYAWVAFSARYYGEVVIAFAVSTPLIVWGLWTWLKHKRQDEVQGSVVVVTKTNFKEILLIAISQMVMGVGYYFLLRAFNTDFLIVSTLSIMTSVFGTILIARRNEYALLAFILNDIVLIVLWGSLVVGGNMEYMPVLLMPIMLLVNDTYGVYNWQKLRRAQTGGSSVPI
jgi:nicotinamide mononucleotide transporter